MEPCPRSRPFLNQLIFSVRFFSKNRPDVVCHSLHKQAIGKSMKGDQRSCLKMHECRCGKWRVTGQLMDKKEVGIQHIKAESDQCGTAQDIDRMLIFCQQPQVFQPADCSRLHDAIGMTQPTADAKSATAPSKGDPMPTYDSWLRRCCNACANCVGVGSDANTSFLSIATAGRVNTPSSTA